MNVSAIVHASESGHWYDRQGRPVWEVTGAKGQPVKPDLRHARKLGLLPGVSSINKCAAAPGLVRYQVKQAVMAALTLPTIPGEPEELYLARIERDAEERGKKAAGRGTDIHSAIQAHYQGNPPQIEFWPYVKLVSEEITKRCGALKWIAEESFGHEAGYGGKADLRSACGSWLLDFKSKDAADLDDPDKKLVWDDHPQQLAAYRRGLEIPRARCANVFVSREEPIIVRFCEHTEADLQRGLSMFDCLLRLWQLKSRYDSSFVRDRLAA